MSLFTLVSEEHGFYIESRMRDVKEPIPIFFQLTRIDMDFIL